MEKMKFRKIYKIDKETSREVGLLFLWTVPLSLLSTFAIIMGASDQYLKLQTALTILALILAILIYFGSRETIYERIK